MMTRCSMARIAARLRSVLHDSHASRTRSDGGISLITVADPVSRSYSRPCLGDRIFGALPDIEPVDPVDHPRGQIAARIGAYRTSLGALDVGQQFGAARADPRPRATLLARAGTGPGGGGCGRGPRPARRAAAHPRAGPGPLAPRHPGHSPQPRLPDRKAEEGAPDAN
jgi:hypothetical protein